MVTVTATNFHGVYPSIVCPFTKSLGIDDKALGDHATTLAETEGIKGLLINGHAGENMVLDRGELEHVIRVVVEAVGTRTIIIAGIAGESSLYAAELALDAERAGADAAMVFAPSSWALGQAEHVAVTHHRMIIDAFGLPIMLFQGSVRGGHLAYTPEVMRELVRLPRVVAIKEGSWETAAYEATRRLIKTVAPEIAVMASGDEHLLSCFVLGSEGSIVSLAIIIPETIVALDQTVRNGDLAEARRLHDIIYPLARAIYGTPPGSWANSRLKACLNILGRLPNALPRPPFSALPPAEMARLERILENTS